MDYIKSSESSKKYTCENCDYSTSRKSQYDRHLLTTKHQKSYKLDDIENDEDDAKSSCFTCKCGKEYKFRQGLWKHKKICNLTNQSTELVEYVKPIEEEQEQKQSLTSDMVLALIKEELTTIVNQQSTATNTDYALEFMKQTQENQMQMFQQMMEFMKQQCATTNNINNGQINNNNTHFNLQVYLNETCKNAMTINQFLDYLEPTIEELEATAHLGYVEGISRIIMTGFKNLEEHELPFHCTDLKREHIYLKNPDEVWVEEKDEKPLLLRFIKEVAKKSFKNLSAWQKKNPNWANYNSKQNDLFNKIVGNSVSGATEEEQQANYEKIMKNIMKHTTINRSKKNSK